MDVKIRADVGSYQIEQLESGTIRVFEKEYVGDGKNVKHLRIIAEEIGVDILNSKGNAKNTRQLGKDIIEKIKE